MASPRDRILKFHFQSIDSTQTKAKELIPKLEGRAALITADLQTAGRGRQGRSWISSDPGNLFASFVTFPSPQTPLHHCCQLLALSAATTLRGFRYPVELKWPNDLMMNNLKLGGVLTELHQGAVVSGIGVNLTSHPEGAISLSTLHPTDKETLIHAVTETYLSNWELFLNEGFHPLFDSFLALFPYKRGSPLTFHAPTGERVNGFFEAITKEGALLLKLEEGSIQSFFSGDIHVRPK